MEQFWTVLERFRNFSSHSIFPISAPLRATIIGTSTWTFPSSYGAERNAFGWEHHLNIAISLAIQYLPSPLRSVPQSSSSYGAERSAFGWEHHLNIAISQLRSAPCHNHWYKHLNSSQFLRSGAERFWMGTPLEHCNFSSHSIFAISAPLRATIKQFLRSGAERFWMGTPLERCNFSSHSLFPSSAPLRATIIGTSTWTVPSSYGAERNAFDNHGNTTWT